MTSFFCGSLLLTDWLVSLASYWERFHEALGLTCRQIKKKCSSDDDVILDRDKFANQLVLVDSYAQSPFISR